MCISGKRALSKGEGTRMSPPARQLSSTQATDASAAASGTENLPFKQFVWGAGVECSFLPHLNVDQFEWTQHDRFWREDLKRAKDELGISYLRYAPPWHK